jgi:hypothetical protein
LPALSTAASGTPGPCPAPPRPIGSGWWTRDGENYYFKWGAVFAEEAEGSYRLKDGGVFDYTLCFIDTDGSQDNIIATYTFQIDLSGYTITADE